MRDGDAVVLATKEGSGPRRFHARVRWADGPWSLKWLTVGDMSECRRRGATVQVSAWVDVDTAAELAPAAFFMPPRETDATSITVN